MTALGLEQRRFIVVGGAGFIGAHLVDLLLADAMVERVTVYDNFSSGRRWHLDRHAGDSRLTVVEADVADLERLVVAARDHEVIVHLASNPDIARAATDPAIDFAAGTLLTHNVVEAMRIAEVKTILYASGSGVYGDLGEAEAAEDHGPLIPVSTYGASKLAGEALIAAYVHMFGIRGRVFRFGNVVGPRQTHGVGFDFVRRLLQDPTELRILGDGLQSKSYIHVEDVLGAVLTSLRSEREPFRAYNVATGDYITVSEIAYVAIEALGLDHAAVRFDYTGGDRGWRGDVPVVRLRSDRIRSLGWSNRRGSHEAMKAAMLAMIPDARAGRL